MIDQAIQAVLYTLPPGGATCPQWDPPPGTLSQCREPCDANHMGQFAHCEAPLPHR